ncbi:hypothetical protein DLH72_03420 [Candidatus Gracilibacteria bacterium]|nr:MAG: hypothetical protein DLH72_03420 [Candidatus Gracilibacteria bacterium]
MTNTKKSNGIFALSCLAIVLTVVNIAFTFFIVDYKIKENEYNTYGGKDIYEKVMYINKTQYENTIGKMTLEDIKNNLGQADGQQIPEQGGNEGTGTMTLSKEDLVPNNPVYGKKDAKFSIYEFGDLECPACKGFHDSGIAKEAVDKNPDTLNYVYRNFQFHQGAPTKAQIALCSIDQKGEQAYFDYVDDIFADKYFPRTTEDDVLAMGEKRGLDKAKLKECLDSGKYKSIVDKEYDMAQRLGVNATPTIFVVNNETGEMKRLTSRSVSAIEELMK